MNYYRPTWNEASIDRLFNQMCKDLLVAPSVDTGHWQATKDVPMTKTRELMNVILELPISGSAGGWAAYIKPNLPWAETHFRERVSGKPLNPPPSHVDWPFNQAGNKDHMDGAIFSHSYPERMWPRYAAGAEVSRRGVRYEYGDLGHAVDLLVQEPTTRQCYIPLWFPEDLHAAAVEHQRVPCTLGYHFLMRNRQLHCFYPMRSLDALRYLRDDAYMAGRLCQWLIGKCRDATGENGMWHEVTPGMLTMHAVSLHIFENDAPFIKRLLEGSRKRVAA